MANVQTFLKNLRINWIWAHRVQREWLQDYFATGIRPLRLNGAAQV